MSQFRIESTRGALVESVHAVSAAVMDRQDRLLAYAGEPDRLTFWRSAAKPFQAMPLVQDGAATRWALGDDELALACGSHSSERIHLDACDRFLQKIGCAESDLACGPHPPLSPAVAEAALRAGVPLTPRWSNCSGKHTGMLALARHREWAIAGYERAGHPVQERVLDEIARWAGVPRDSIRVAVDGCTAVSHALPLAAMARAYARFAVSDEPAALRLREAMMARPALVAGTGRLCTDLMNGWRGEIIAKVGAEGVYGAALPGLGVGIALKVEDGDMRSAAVALVRVLRQVLHHLAPDRVVVLDQPAIARHAELPIVNTRGTTTGSLRAAGTLRFAEPARGAAARIGQSNEVE